MTCPKCKSSNIYVDKIPWLFMKRRRFIDWLLYGLLVILTLSLILLIPFIKNRIDNAKRYNIAICKDCGFSWKLEIKYKARSKIPRRQLPPKRD